MAWNYIYLLLGGMLLLTRFYILEIRFKEELKPRNRYLSRMLVYIYSIALIFNFKIMTLNFSLLYAYMLELFIVFKHDLSFFVNYIRNEPLNNNEPHSPFLLYERITLHIPIVITCTIWLIMDISPFYINNQPPPIQDAILGLIVGFLTFVIFDARNPFGKAFEPPLGKNILYIMFASALISNIYIYLVVPIV